MKDTSFNDISNRERQRFFTLWQTTSKKSDISLSKLRDNQELPEFGRYINNTKIYTHLFLSPPVKLALVQPLYKNTAYYNSNQKNKTAHDY